MRLIHSVSEICPELQIVVFNNPYSQWHKDDVRTLFGKVIAIRKAGYESRHKSGVLPVDTYDFIGRHFVLCTVENGVMNPIMSYKNTYLSQCRFYNLPLPIESMLKGLSDKRHYDAMSEIICNAEKRGRDIAYTSSWTMKPELHKDKNLFKHAYSVMTGMNVLSFHDEAPQERIACGVLRLKTDKYIGDFLGYLPVEGSEGALPPFQQANLQNDPVLLMHLKNGYTQQAIEEAEQSKNLWRNRIILDDSDNASHSERTAA